MIKLDKVTKSNYFLLSIILLVATYCFIENFLFSSFDLLILREIDDVAFQSSLATVHGEIMKFHFDKLLRMNDYGYGWIFWFPMAILTFPLYLIKEGFGVEWPLIVLPRQISLVFSFATLYLVYKSLAIYTKNEWIKISAILLYLSSPVFGFYAMKFHPTAQVNFFCCLAFYLTVKEETIDRKTLKKIAIALALAAATKLNGLLISPLIALLLADRFGWKLNKENIKNAAFFTAIFLLTFIAFSNPLILFAVFEPEILTHYLSAMSASIALGKSNYGNEAGFANNFLQGIVKGNFHMGIFYFLCALFIAKVVIDFKNIKSCRRFDFAYIFLSQIIVFAYLCESIKLGSEYIIAYCGVVYFSMIFSIIVFDNVKKKLFFLPLLILLINLYFNFDSIFSQDGSAQGFHYNVFYERSASSAIATQIELQKEMQKMVGSPDNYPDGLKILQDYHASTIYSNFKKNVAVYYVFDNIGSASQVKYDFILISKKNSAFFSKEQFDELIILSNQKIKEDYILNREIINNLLSSGLFGGVKYRLLLKNGDILLFQKFNN